MQSIFEQIKDRLSITDVLASYITLIPSGSNFKAKCPFHNERSASFSISPERGLYYCFGCGARGDIFTFIEQFEGIDRKGALKILAERAGVELVHTTVPRERTDALYEILESATTRYQQELARRPDVIAYLHARGITDATIALFRIGYAPDEWRFVAHACNSEIESQYAERAGLIKKTEKGYYDRFRKRVMFPLKDASGRIVGFSGRIFPEDTTHDVQNPKYLNSPETELFQKSRILFGFDKAKNAIRTHNFAILVEGQMDCVLSHQAGFTNTVATSGTAVSDQAAADPTANLVVLSRLTPHIFLAFDGDTAGQKALTRAAIVALSLGMNPKVVPLTDGKDPADFIVENGGDAWKQLLKKSQHFILHQLASIDRTTLSPHMLVQALRQKVFPFLIRVTSPIEQGTYREAIAKEFGISEIDIAKELELFSQQQPTSVQFSESETSEEVVESGERLVAFMKRYPVEGTDHIRHQYETLAFDNYRYTSPDISEERMVQLLALVEKEYDVLHEHERLDLMKELFKKVREQFFDSIRTTLTHALRQAERTLNEEEAHVLLEKLQMLNRRRHEDIY